MTTRALHKLATREDGEGLDLRRSLCGKAGDLTADGMDVTCGLCRRKMKADAKALRMARLSGLASALAVKAAQPDGPYAVERGAHELDAHGQQVVERSQRGEALERKGPIYRNERHVAESLASYYDTGATIASSSAPSRFGTEPKGTAEGRVSNVERGVDRIVGALKAIDAAYLGGMQWGDVYVSPALCREIWLWRHAGKPVYSSARAECIARHDVSTESIVDMARGVCRFELTTRQVGLIVRRGNDEVRAYLERTGELGVRRRAA